MTTPRPRRASAGDATANAETEATGAQDDPNAEVIIGVPADFDEGLADVGLDPEDFTTGFLDDAELTIIGFKTQKGGETRDDNRGGTFVTSDNLIVQFRVDNVDGIDNTKQFLSLPKTYVDKATGKTKRRPVSASSKYGIWLGALAGIGVAKRDDIATTHKFDTLNDLIGLKIHRMRQTFESGFRGQTVEVEVAVEVLGMDNDVRQEAGLQPLQLKNAA